MTVPTKSLRILACSGTSRVPAPRPIDSIVSAGSDVNRSTTVARIAAPVGVVISPSTIDSASGTPRKISAVAGAGSGIRP